MKRLFSRSERGQILVMTALLVPVLLGMTGMAVDVGSYASERRSLQNAADSIALAAAQELPDVDDALVAGNNWAAKNGIDSGDLAISFNGLGDDEIPTVTVRIDRTHEFAFVQVIGIDSAAISARAVAQKVSYGGGSGVVPWAVKDDVVMAADNGELVTLKYDASGVSTGNFGAIRLDGSGSSVYGASAKYGSSTVACADTTDGCATSSCPGVYPTVCGETSPECDGPSCGSQTGNMVGNTEDAVEFRLNHTSDDCDTFNEAFPTQDDDTGKYQLDPDCNPWTDGAGACTSTTDLCSRQVIIIPVIDEFGSGTSDPLTIIRFALFYLEGYEAGGCTGSVCEVQGRFVWADINARSLAGTYDPDSTIHFARLSE